MGRDVPEDVLNIYYASDGPIVSSAAFYSYEGAARVGRTYS